jgi:hypothetical protein
MDEEVLLEQPGLRVTRAKVTALGGSYALDKVESVRTITVPPPRGAAVLMGLGGAAVGVVAFGICSSGVGGLLGIEPAMRSMGSSFVVSGVGLGGLAVLMIAGAVAMIVTQRGDRYSVALRAASGERRVYHSRDRDAAEAVRAAIEQAMTQRR